MKNSILFLTAITILFYSCVEKYDLELDKTSKKLVVEGFIGNTAGPYYFRLTKSKNGLIMERTPNTDIFGVEPELNATIIVSDDMGTIDTLIPSPIDTTYQYIYDDYGYIVDTMIYVDGDDLQGKDGFYQTTKIQGQAGHTYYLYIKTRDGNEYTASSTMPSCPQIDSLSYHVNYKIEGWAYSYSPMLYFAEPQNEKNYYLFYEGEFARIGRTWYYTLIYFCIDDTKLPAYVSGLRIDRIVDGLGNGCYLTDDSPYLSASLTCVGEKEYRFFKALADQVISNGSVFRPAVATPPGNISNGAIGLFCAYSTSFYRRRCFP